MVRFAVAAAALLSIAACAGGPVQSANFDPMTCKVYTPKAGEPEFNADCLRAAQASNEAYKREAARAAAARAKEAAKKGGS
ncbi:MAG: hypothetical protein ACOYJ6_07020 [Caulobacterales bacterium]|jgi:hypothetical protein